MTRSRDVADSQDNLGGAVAPFVAGKNFVINGGFDIWQRGTSFTGTPFNGFVADRWISGSDQTVAVTRQTSGAPVGQRYYIRNAVTSGTGYVALYQNIETANVIPLQGKVVTASIKLRRSAGYTGSMTLKIQKNNSVDISSGGWTDITGSNVIIANASIPTGTTSADWYTATSTFTVPDDGTALTLRFAVEPNVGYTSSAYWELSSVQLELGNQATPFARSGGSIGGELALCQRYYYRQTFSAIGERFGSGYAGLATLGRVEITFPVTMRVQPTALEQTGTAGDYSVSGASVNAVCTSVPTWFNSCTRSGIVDLTVASVLTPGVGVSFRAASAAAYFGWSAEL